MTVVGRDPEIEDTGSDHDDGRHEERRTPAEPCGKRGADPGGERDAEIPAYSVERERASSRIRCLDKHRHSDRMIDRREHAEREHRSGQRHQIRREPCRGER
jgi:hypothetical protein